MTTATLPGYETRRLTSDLELRIAGPPSAKRLIGYAARFNALSEPIFEQGIRFREMITQGAFRNTLSDGHTIRGLTEHGGGTATLASTANGSLKLAEDGQGLRFEITLPDTTVGNDIHKLVSDGLLDSMSFGFRIPPGGDDFREVDGQTIRTLNEVELHEVSVVSSPAYTTTSVSARARKMMGNNRQLRADTRHGFENFGTFLAAVIRNRTTLDPRLDKRAALSTYGQESVGADGGFAVPPEFRDELDERIRSASLAALCDEVVISSNLYSAPIDSDAPWDTSTGVQVAWEGEASTFAQSKPSFELANLKLNKIVGLVGLTDELTDDAPALRDYVGRKLSSKVAFALDLAILQGDGSNRPLGILTAPATISVAKESGQTADTVVEGNLTAMWSRLAAPSRQTAVWVCHPSVQDQIWQIDSRIISDDGRIFGRPVTAHEGCEVVGDKLDIVLADFAQYALIRRTSRLTTSLHLWFDNDTAALRFSLRVAGQPWWSGPISGRVGSTTTSPFVTLDERA